MAKKDITKEKSSGKLKSVKQRLAAAKVFDDKEKYKAVFEFAGDIILLIDDSGIITDANNKLSELGGYKLEEFIGQNIRALVGLMTAKSKAKVLRNFKKRMAGAQIAPYEVELLKKNRELLTFEINAQILRKNGNIIGDLVILRDITQRKMMEEALKDSEKNYRDFLDNSSMGIRVRDEDDSIFYLNRAYLDIFGFENIEEAKASSPIEHYTPESYAEYRARAEKIARGENVNNKIEVDIVSKDGSIRHVQVFGRVVIRNGKRQGQTFYNDITAITQAENVVKNSEQNLSNALDKLPMGFRITDFDENTVYLNQAFLDIFGYENADEVKAKPPVITFYTPESYAAFLLRREKLLRGEPREKSVRVDIIRKDGVLRHLLLFSGEVIWNNKKHIQTLSVDITEQTHVERALIKSEQNLHNALDNLPMGIRIADKDDNSLYLNQAFLNIYGYKNIDETRNIKLIDHYTPESYAEYMQRHERRLNGAPHQDTIEVDIIRKDGAIRHLQLSSTKLFWDGNEQALTIFNDVTERKQAEQLYNTLSESSPGGVYIAQNEKFVFTNTVFQKNIGYTADELATISPETLVYPEDRDIVRQSAVQMLKGERNQPYVFRVITKSGEIRWGLETMTSITWGGKRAMLGNFIDITERKQAEERLEQAAQEWRITFDSITDIISIHDKDNRIVRINKAMADLVKKTPQELVGQFCHEVMHGTKDPPANCPHLLTIKSGKPAVLEMFNPNFEAYFHESTSPLFNEKGEVSGSVIVARDVTQQKRMEEQLILTDRLASIGELSSGIAHELNNPLTSVIGFSQLLIQGNVPDNIKEDLSIIYSEAQRAAVIVKNLLTFARKHAPVTQLSQINIVIEDVLRLRSYEQRVNNIEVEKHLAAALPEIMMDPFQIQQVFLNIIVNAEFAMLEAHQRGKLVITTEKSDGVVKITFADDGPGITEANLKRIFNPFFTTKEVGKGTGLGLSICHGIITEHGGKIYVRSVNGQGAAFIVELPLNG
jgi:PAS domain S-box-containing protein